MNSSAPFPLVPYTASHAWKQGAPSYFNARACCNLKYRALEVFLLVDHENDQRFAQGKWEVFAGFRLRD